MAPALVIAYNRFMNAVDRVDQHRAANPIQRKESRIYMAMWSMYVDMGVNNAFSLFRSIADGHGAKKMEFKEFKRRISESLVTPFVNSRRKRRAPIALDVDSPPPVCGDGQILVTPSRIECAIGNICSVHVLTENKGIDGKAGRQLRFEWENQVHDLRLYVLLEMVSRKLFCNVPLQRFPDDPSC